jgi:hypothetical protein
MWARYFSVRPSAPTETASVSRRIRQLHRWLAIAFTLTVVANLAAMTRGQPPAWITYSPLPPLFLLMFSGLCMFSLPYVARRRAAN